MQERIAQDSAADGNRVAGFQRTAAYRKFAGPFWTVASLLHGAAVVVAWVAAEFWSLLHVLIWLPPLFAFAAALLGLWCAYWMSQTILSWARNAYFGLLLRSARRF